VLNQFNVVAAVNANPAIVYVYSWVYPDDYKLATGGDAPRGRTLRMYSRISDAETPSSGLTVSVSYRRQAGSWTTVPASYNPGQDYWYVDWTISGDAQLGLYDVKVDVIDPNGGSASTTVLNQFNVV
jgi:hypothetical protein